MSPGKWQRVWRERFPATPLFASLASQDESFAGLRSGEFAAALVRMPIPGTGEWHRIPLYEEVSVVVVPVEHELTLLAECTPEDLAGEIVLDPPGTGLIWDEGDSAMPGRRSTEEPPSVKEAIEWCAASAGQVIVPMSLARLHHRKDVTYVPLAGVPTSRIALTWVRWLDDPLIEELAGIVRGRGANSSRGESPQPVPGPVAAERSRTVAARAPRKAQSSGKPTPRETQRKGEGSPRPGGKSNNGKGRGRRR
ncbi:LysR substrate-binding domain-containing protein [Rarobacter faecitabidus]|uniref:LysR substrate-binding domain-containing protein n=1 Tax=Rarobacter faecitabidus TaxID=13243 RepID=UPI00147731CD|nr:LysR substrate-binding domain-containing protein [Rarobacter faecitabidus]